MEILVCGFFLGSSCIIQLASFFSRRTKGMTFSCLLLNFWCHITFLSAWSKFIPETRPFCKFLWSCYTPKWDQHCESALPSGFNPKRFALRKRQSKLAFKETSVFLIQNFEAHTTLSELCGSYVKGFLFNFNLGHFCLPSNFSTLAFPKWSLDCLNTKQWLSLFFAGTASQLLRSFLSQLLLQLGLFFARCFSNYCLWLWIFSYLKVNFACVDRKDKYLLWSWWNILSDIGAFYKEDLRCIKHDGSR